MRLKVCMCQAQAKKNVESKGQAEALRLLRSGQSRKKTKRKSPALRLGYTQKMPKEICFCKVFLPIRLLRSAFFEEMKAPF